MKIFDDINVDQLLLDNFVDTLSKRRLNTLLERCAVRGVDLAENYPTDAQIEADNAVFFTQTKRMYLESALEELV